MGGPDLQLVNWIAAGLEGCDLFTVDEVLGEIASGQFQLWRYPKGCMVTQITEHFGRRRVLVFLLAGRDLDEWQHQATEDLMAFARNLGIPKIDAYARPGLERVLKPLGWRRTQVVLELEV